MIALFVGVTTSLLLVVGILRVRGTGVALSKLSKQRDRRQRTLVVACSRLVRLLSLHDQRATRRDAREMEASLYLAANLVVVALGNGCNVRGAVAAVSAHCPGALGRALEDAAKRMRNGMSAIESLEQLRADVPRSVQAFVSTLLAGERYGAPLSEVLVRLADQCRAEQRRHVERSAKRLTVQLLFPLAVFILPAFALLTLAPVIASALGALASNHG